MEQRPRQHLARVARTMDRQVTSFTNLSLSATLVLAATIVAPVCDVAQSQSTRSGAPETVLGAAPLIIGPGVISTPAEEFRVTVSPDNRTIVYVVTDHLFRHMTLVQAERDNNRWSTPEVVSFSGIWRDGDPSFAPDGRTLFFISNRPLSGDPASTPRRDFNIWQVQRR
jgi:Tol biopolymer transport system component